MFPHSTFDPAADLMRSANTEEPKPLPDPEDYRKPDLSRYDPHAYSGPNKPWKPVKVQPPTRLTRPGWVAD